MSHHGSVTIWLHRLKDGSRDEAVERLWAVYFGKLVAQARNRLRTRSRAVADEEDVALGAFDSFVRATEAGRFPRLDDRDDLWQILLMLTARKAADVAEWEAAAKRCSGRVVSFAEIRTREGSDTAFDPVSAEPDPAEAARLADDFEALLRKLPDADLRRIAVWKMEGHTNEIIARNLDVALATVERKLRRIRDLLATAQVDGG